jgi:hypothetical protein
MQISLLHAAYLSLFTQFGYAYIFRAETNWIRELLVKTELRENPQISIVQINHNDLKLPTNRTADDLIFANAFVWFDDGTRSMVSFFPSPNVQPMIRGILMPGFGREDFNVVRQRTGRVGATTVLDFHQPDLTTKDGALYGQNAWHFSQRTGA